MRLIVPAGFKEKPNQLNESLIAFVQLREYLKSSKSPLFKDDAVYLWRHFQGIGNAIILAAHHDAPSVELLSLERSPEIRAVCAFRAAR